MKINGAVYINVEAVADIIWELKKHNLYKHLETGEYAAFHSDRIDDSTPSPDEDTAHDLDYEEADNGVS